MKKKATRSQRAEEKSKLASVEAAESEFDKRKKALEEKTQALKKEADELEQYRRQQILTEVTGFGLSMVELDAFLAVFSEMPGRQDIANRLMEQLKAKLTQPNGNMNPDHFLTKLIRMGFL